MCDILSWTEVEMISNAYCKKHEEMESQSHDLELDGLWVCPKCAREQQEVMFEPLPCGRMPLDVAAERIREMINKES